MPARPGGPIAVRAHLDPQAILLEAARRHATAKSDPPPPIWTPNPGPQTAALETLADETYYGGAAGGGKSDWLIGMALLRHRHSIIFRRTYTEMGELIQRTQKILGERNLGSYNVNERIWRLPSGQTLSFGAMEHLDDQYRYRGRAHDLKAYDEVSSFLEEQYIFTSSWARATYCLNGHDFDDKLSYVGQSGVRLCRKCDAPKQPVRICATGNPPTAAEGFWVIERFAPWLDPSYPGGMAEDGELRWFVNYKDPTSGEVIETGFYPHGHPNEGMLIPDATEIEYGGETLYPRSRTFYPAKVWDNPYLSTDTAYMANLQSKPRELREQLLEGNHSAGMGDQDLQVIPTKWVDRAMERWRLSPKPYDELISALGVDVARGGRANTVLSKRYGLWFDELSIHPGATTPDGQAVVDAVVRETGGARPRTYIDVNGAGSSPYDTLVAMSWPVTGIHSSNKWPYYSKEGHRFVNARAGMWWAMRELLDPQNGNLVCLPDDKLLRAELVSPTYKITSSGVQVEEKDEVMKRLHRSTDRADALLLAAMGGEQQAKAKAVPYSFRSAVPKRYHTTTSALRALNAKKR